MVAAIAALQIRTTRTQVTCSSSTTHGETGSFTFDDCLASAGSHSDKGKPAEAPDHDMEVIASEQDAQRPSHGHQDASQRIAECQTGWSLGLLLPGSDALAIGGGRGLSEEQSENIELHGETAAPPAREPLQRQTGVSPSRRLLCSGDKALRQVPAHSPEMSGERMHGSQQTSGEGSSADTESQALSASPATATGLPLPVLPPKPSEQPSPARQILDALVPMSPAAALTEKQASEGPQRTFGVILKPDELGQVRVTLKKRGSDMEIRLDSERRETARLLSLDSSWLKMRLDELSCFSEAHHILVAGGSGEAETYPPFGDGGSASDPRRSFQSPTGNASAENHAPYPRKKTFGHSPASRGGNDETSGTRGSIQHGIIVV